MPLNLIARQNYTPNATLLIRFKKRGAILLPTKVRSHIVGYKPLRALPARVVIQALTLKFGGTPTPQFFL